MYHITKLIKSAIYLSLVQPVICHVKELKACIDWWGTESLCGLDQNPRIYFNNFL